MAAFGAETNHDAEADAGRTAEERAARIVAGLDLEDGDRAERVGEVIAGHYRRLREVHDAREARIREAAQRPGDPTVAGAWENVVRSRAALRLFELHRRFVARLSAELTPAQVEVVKEGMTDGVAAAMYRGYRERVPGLSDAQRAEVLARLLEAREYAMGAASDEEQRRIFRQYQEHIERYLSAAGHELNEAPPQ